MLCFGLHGLINVHSSPALWPLCTPISHHSVTPATYQSLTFSPHLHCTSAVSYFCSLCPTGSWPVNQMVTFPLNLLFRLSVHTFCLAALSRTVHRAVQTPSNPPPPVSVWASSPSCPQRLCFSDALNYKLSSDSSADTLEIRGILFLLLKHKGFFSTVVSSAWKEMYFLKEMKVCVLILLHLSVH